MNVAASEIRRPNVSISLGQFGSKQAHHECSQVGLSDLLLPPVLFESKHI